MPRKSFKKAVSLLLKEVIVEETHLKVWSVFKQVFFQLDQASQKLARDYFSGLSIPSLSKIHHMSESDVKKWISSIKRNLIENLRKHCQVEQ